MIADLADVVALAELARVDWLYAGRCERLHAPATATYDVDEWCAVDVTFACGWKATQAWIPGIGSRMGLPRCAHCCKAWGMPRGDGSPKNDDTCRSVLWLDPSHNRSVQPIGQPIGPPTSGERSHGRTDGRTNEDRPTETAQGADRSAHEEPPR